MGIYHPSDAYRINSVCCLPSLQIPFSRLPVTLLLTASKPHNESGQANLHGVCYACADAVYEFLSPIPVGRFAIKIPTNVKHKLFKKALDIADKTSDILDYLDSVSYVYPEQLIRKLEPVKITQSQLHIIKKHRKLTKILRMLSCEDIRNNKRFRLEITDANELSITDLLNEEFEMSDISKIVSSYMDYCHGKCICIDEANDVYLPCYNAILISAQKPLHSFLSFCRDIDPDDPFTTIKTWREKTN